MTYRIIDANLNRTCEGLRNIEEYCRFVLDDKNLCEQLKNIRHEVTQFFEPDYDKLINSRNTQKDVGINLDNITEKKKLKDPLKANLKRTQQALRVLSEYGSLDEKYRYALYTIEQTIMEKISMEKITNLKQTLLKDKNLYLITSSDNCSCESEFIDKVAMALDSGVRIIQYREKNKNAKEIIQTGKKLRQLTSQYDALFIVNDRIDIAQILDSDGVHLGQDDIDINLARNMLGENKIIGISTHKPEDAILAVQNKADYIGVGPVFKTPTKPNTDPVGLDYVRWVSKNIKLPFYAIGSIDENNVDEVIKAGASNVAVIRAIMNSADIKNTVNKINEKLNGNNK